MAIINGKKVLQVVQTQNVVGTMEEIKDANGNLRFREGNISLSSSVIADGLTLAYGKWSLSGSHLMIVLCVNIPKDVASSSPYLTYITLPTWVMNKIQPIISGGGEIVNATKVSIITENAYVVPDPSVTFLLRKWTATELVIQKSSISADTVNKRAFRVQFDLLIDNE